MTIEKYKRGFIFYDQKNFSFPRDLNFEIKEITENYAIAYDNYINVYVKKHNKKIVCMCGTFFDTYHFSMDKNYICENLLNLFKNPDDLLKNIQLLNYLDYLNGRYVLFLIYNKKVIVLNDASGLRSVFYHTELNIISSHYNLINIFCNEKESDFYESFVLYCDRQKSKNKPAPWCLPGNLTPYKNIKQLICNHYLTINDHKLKRFFPREEAKIENVTVAYKYIAETIKKQLNIINKQYSILQSLTAGNDSRMSLSACKDIKDDVTFFTYAMSDDENIDMSHLDPDNLDAINNLIFAKKASNILKLNFMFVKITNCLSEEELGILRHNHYHQSNAGIVSGFKNKKLPKNVIHIRTNITELLRHSYFTVKNESSKEEIAKKFTSWSMYYDESDEFYNKVYKYYMDFIDELDIISIKKYKYSLGDMFYLEYRMNQWLSSVLIQQDHIFDTFILFNTRKILEYGMNIPRQWKDKNIFVEKIVDYLWPDLDILNLPNIPSSSNELVDLGILQCIGLIRFDKNIRKQYNWHIVSGNFLDDQKQIEYIVKPRIEGLTVGFSGNEVKKDDYIDVKITTHVVNSCIYYFEFNILTFWNMLYRNDEIQYCIIVDNKKIYSLSTNIFSRPNQIIYIFKADTNCDINIIIRLQAIKDCCFRDYNGLIDIRNIILRQEFLFDKNKFNTDKKIIYSTYEHMLKIKNMMIIENKKI